jgi:two-component system CheB/CheR fusion protein
VADTPQQPEPDAQDDTTKTPQLVVIGSSAGGIDALSILVAKLPRDFSAPIIIAQHLDPQRPSHLGEILSRTSPLPVKTILDRDELMPGTVFVVPADRHVDLEDGHLRLIEESSSQRPRPSINLLFSSAARVFGEGLIAVILTGTGSDGAAGAQQVKLAGGTVIIQNPATALFPGMPLSLAPTSIDMVADVDQIGPLLYELVTGTVSVSHRRENKALSELLDFVHEHSGIDFGQYKMPTIIRRLKRRMIAESKPSLLEYTRHVKRDPAEYQRLVSSFLIKVTEFFRDQPLFDTLRRDVLPELIEYARHHGNVIRVWSAGCATGEEAYSVAILIADLLGDELEQFKVNIFATDADGDAIAFARRGIYSAAAVRQVPEHLANTYFVKHDGEYSVAKRVRSMIIFGEHDLGRRAPFPHIDLIMCRNVLIYFTTDLQKRVLHLFAYSLRDGGYLVLGKAETVSPLSSLFVATDGALKIYRRHGERFLLAAGEFSEAAPPGVSPFMPRPVLARPRATVPTTAGHATSEPRPRTSVEWLGAVMLGLPAGVVLIDRHYDVQIINQTALQMLDIRRAAVGEDLLHLAEHVPTRELRDLIDSALRGQQPTPITVTLTTDTGAPVYLQIAAFPYPSEDHSAPIANVLLQVMNITANVQEQQALEQQRAAVGQVKKEVVSEDPARLQVEIDELREQVRRLTMVNRELRDANQDLINGNLELRRAHEEMQVNVEELQASSEEVETLNEELQASNEELETLNEELQATVEELNTVNDDMEARSRDTQTTVATLESQQRAEETERAHLEAILNSIGDAVLVVSRAGDLTFKNTAFEQMFGVNDFVADDPKGRPLPAEHTPQRRASRGESFTMVFTHTDARGVRRQLEASGQPLARDELAEGGVLVIRDITDRKDPRR